MVRPVLGITLEGPFFARQPSRTFRQNIRVFMDRVAQVGEAEVKRRLLTDGREGAHTEPFVLGRTRSLSGRRWACTARVSVSTQGLSAPQAIRRQAIAAGRHQLFPHGTTRGAEGQTHAFRDSRKAVEDAMKAHAGDLTKGLT